MDSSEGAMTELHRRKKGRVAELQVAATLLADGHDVYAPLVDDRGIDFLIRRPDGSVDEIQVKSVTKGRWFQVQERAAPEEAGRPRRWIICVEADATTGVIPTAEFTRHAGASRGDGGVFTYDLDLDVTRKDETLRNCELLAEYRNAWQLLR
jgi:hypothetical protein